MSSAPDYHATPVLVVDDEPEMLRIAELSYAADFRLLTASSGAAALEIIEREPVVVLLTDQRMPGMSGLELVRAARTRRPDLISILLTGYLDDTIVAEASNLGGIRRCITKPFVIRELREEIRQAIETHHLMADGDAPLEGNARLVEESHLADERLAHEHRHLQERASSGGWLRGGIGERSR